MNIQNTRKPEREDVNTLEDEFDTGDNRKEREESVADHDAVDKRQQGILLIDKAVDNNAMPELTDQKNINDSLNTGSQTQFKKNRRVTTRFIRDDIATAIRFAGLLGFGKTISVGLVDIASKGVLISTKQKLGINKKIILTLRFKSGKVFVIKAIVVRQAGSARNEYGIKFDRYNNELGDYLLETQEKLIFK
jgi:hypothetical protein